eukprot:Opistho-2@69712
MACSSRDICSAHLRVPKKGAAVSWSCEAFSLSLREEGCPPNVSIGVLDATVSADRSWSAYAAVVVESVPPSITATASAPVTCIIRSATTAAVDGSTETNERLCVVSGNCMPRSPIYGHETRGAEFGRRSSDALRDGHHVEIRHADTQQTYAPIWRRNPGIAPSSRRETSTHPPPIPSRDRRPYFLQRGPRSRPPLTSPLYAQENGSHLLRVL